MLGKFSIGQMEKRMFDLQKYQQNIAFYDDNNHYVTYGDIKQVAKEIDRLIGSRNLIYLLCDNTIGSLVYYVAFLYTNNVIQIVSCDNRGEWIEKNYLAFQPNYICKPIEFRDCSSLLLHQFMGYGIFKGNDVVTYEIYSNLSLLIPSSGSTGECKYVRQSKENIQANTGAIIECLGLSCNDKPILALPMSYTYGLSIVNTHVSVGATILVSKKKILQKEFWEFFNQQKGTSFSGVPYSYEILNRFRFFDWKLPCLNCMTQAGGKLSNELIRKFSEYAKKKNIRFYVMYGQTEATARMTCLPYQYVWENEKIGSVGIAIPGTEIYLEDTTGKRIRESKQEGEIIFEGENVTLGYAESYFDLDKGDDNQGILRTGDVAYLDEDGFVYITGRKKRFVKICGKRISLDSIEAYISERYSDQMDYAIVGNDKKIFVIINQEDACAKIENDLLAYYQFYKSNLSVEYWKNIPKTLSGKTDYNEIMKKILVR